MTVIMAIAFFFTVRGDHLLSINKKAVIFSTSPTRIRIKRIKGFSELDFGEPI
jgi:hypothetical protein